MSVLPTEWKNALQGIAPVEVVKRIEGLLVRGQTASLSPDKEAGPFLLYVLGDDIEDIAQKTGTPVDVMYLTCLTYRWQEKRDELSKKGNTVVINALQKSIVNHLLAATQLSVMNQVGKVMSGEIDASECSLIPKNIKSLKELMELVTAVNDLVSASEQKDKPVTVVNAQNVQIQNFAEEKKQEISREEMLRALAGESDG